MVKEMIKDGLILAYQAILKTLHYWGFLIRYQYHKMYGVEIKYKPLTLKPPTNVIKSITSKITHQDGFGNKETMNIGPDLSLDELSESLEKVKRMLDQNRF